MISLKRIQWEYKLSIFLGMTALILSPVLSLIAGNSIGVVVIRALIFGFIFAALGFGIVFVLKIFVPELYSLLFSDNNSGDIEMGEDGSDDVSHSPIPSDDLEMKESTESVSESDMPDEDAGSSLGVNNSQESHLDNPEGGKMGKHVLEEKGFDFEPKVMAEAIRTMMSKDEE